MLDAVSSIEKAGRVLRALGSLARGTPEERAKLRVLRELVIAVSAELTEANADAQQPLTDAILEHLAFPSQVPPRCGTLADSLRYGWTAQLRGLFEPLEDDKTSNAVTNLDVDIDLGGLIDALLRQLPNTIGLYALDVPPLHAFATELRVNLQTESLALSNELRPGSILSRRGFGQQALQVEAFVQFLGVDVPTVTVYNDSDAAISDVEVACWLEAFEPGVRGQQTALIGSNIPFLSVREIGPRSGWSWPFGGSEWNEQERVRSQLHAYFRDASGQRWLSAHDSLKPLDDDK
jgi:hypothetical protein